jgi:hypothetical protein
VGEPAQKTTPNMHLVEESDPVPMCDEEPYPRLGSGEYTARCIEARGIPSREQHQGTTR